MVRELPRSRMTEEPELTLGLGTVKNAVDSYMEALSRQSLSRYKLPAVSIPRYKSGGGWRCFIADFKDTQRSQAVSSADSFETICARGG